MGQNIRARPAHAQWPPAAALRPCARSESDQCVRSYPPPCVNVPTSHSCLLSSIIDGAQQLTARFTTAGISTDAERMEERVGRGGPPPPLLSSPLFSSLHPPPIFFLSSHYLPLRNANTGNPSAPEGPEDNAIPESSPSPPDQGQIGPVLPGNSGEPTEGSGFNRAFF
ncbi:unnamed protein product [Menidia menidia]|uniref:(Atlantic silverside) hypothetical protein n=1 Tax=Menidia menidia TaxID=238744 RepID=A0A8S4BFV6_9TELE|nr:unnamed protein product [Menidia menidia]